MVLRRFYLASLLTATAILSGAGCSTAADESQLSNANGSLSIAESSLSIAESSLSIAESSLSIAEGSLSIAEGSLPKTDGSFPQIDELLFESNLGSEESVSDWTMEGPGEVSFRDGWMEMLSPEEQGHHVFWSPHDFPDSFVARWEAQNLSTDAGLVIVFFAAKGVDGEDIFDPALPARDGTFTHYTEGSIKSYHISYYAHAAHNPSRGHANLRKNNTFSLLQEGEVGIQADSTDPHQITLVKEEERIRLYVNDRKVIDYEDTTPVVDGVDTGDALMEGKIGFRQMQWTQFRYRNLEVYSIK